MLRLLFYVNKLIHTNLIRMTWGIATLLWCCILLLFTCTDNLNAMLFRDIVQFHWSSGHVDLHNLFITSDAHVLNPFWIFVKLGHLSGFAILDLLLARLLYRPRIALSLTILFAVFTELLQLGFGRDGRLYDIEIDSIGAIIMVLTSFEWHREHVPALK